MVKELTVQFMPYKKLEGLTSEEKLKKLLEIVKTEKIVLIEGHLTEIEEGDLIKKTMEMVDQKFTGIEICRLDIGEENVNFMNKLKEIMVGIIMGNRRGLTVIGPATVIKEIKRDPNKIQLFLK